MDFRFGDDLEGVETVGATPDFRFGVESEVTPLDARLLFEFVETDFSLDVEGDSALKGGEFGTGISVLFLTEDLRLLLLGVLGDKETGDEMDACLFKGRDSGVGAFVFFLMEDLRFVFGDERLSESFLGDGLDELRLEGVNSSLVEEDRFFFFFFDFLLLLFLLRPSDF